MNDTQSEVGIWWPIDSEWRAERLHMLLAMHAGLAAAGVESMVREVGLDPYKTLLLWVHAPAEAFEEAEYWLLRFVAPWERKGASWASDVVAALHRRWHEFIVWGGRASDLEAVLRRLPAARSSPPALFPGARFGVVGVEPRSLFVYSRTATEIARFLPDLRIAGPAEVEDPQHWLAIDVAYDEEGIGELCEFELGLQSAGFSTCRYELAEPRVALLTIYSGDDYADKTAGRVREGLEGVTAPWKKRYHPWLWYPTCVVYRAPAEQGSVGEWLGRQIGASCVDSTNRGSQGEVLLKVPVLFADQATRLLATMGDP